MHLTAHFLFSQALSKIARGGSIICPGTRIWQYRVEPALLLSYHDSLYREGKENVQKIFYVRFPGCPSFLCKVYDATFLQ